MGFWMEGKPAEKDIMSPQGKLMEKAGTVRNGGCFEARMGSSPLERGDGWGPLHGPEWISSSPPEFATNEEKRAPFMRRPGFVR